MRKYQKPHLCRHAGENFNVLISAKDSCPKLHHILKRLKGQGIVPPRAPMISKATCRECTYFEPREVPRED